jgi:hypothetical protein
LAREQSRRHVETERLRGFEVQNCFVFGRRLHQQVGKVAAAQDTVHAGRGAVVMI